MKNPYSLFLSKKNSTEPIRHAKRSWRNRERNFSFSKLILWLTILFLFVPLFVIILYSFNESKDTEFTNFSFIWYEKLFMDSDDLWSAMLNSVIIAVSSSLVATILGTLAAIGVTWYDFKGKSYIKTISFLPMVLPEVIMGVSLCIFFTAIKMRLGMTTIFIAHTTFCLPFVYLMVSARIDEFDYSIIEASYDLGATERQTLFKVIIPAIMPGIISGFVMSVTLSLEDYVITSLVSGPGSTTLPVYVYSMIRFGVSPVINSLSLIMVIIICFVAVSMRKRLKSFASTR